MDINNNKYKNVPSPRKIIGVSLVDRLFRFLLNLRYGIGQQYYCCDK
jgi:hypothetical protein